jgi:hypothetical protein
VATSIFSSTILIHKRSPYCDYWFWPPPAAFSAFEELEAKCWLCGNGFVSMTGDWAKSLAAFASLGHNWVRWSFVQRLQGNFTLRFSRFSSPTLLPIFSLLSLDLLPFSHPYDYYVFSSYFVLVVGYHLGWSTIALSVHPSTEWEWRIPTKQVLLQTGLKTLHWWILQCHQHEVRAFV